MEGLISHGQGDIDRNFAGMSDCGRSSSSEPRIISRPGSVSGHQQGGSSKNKSSANSKANGTQSNVKTWKDKPGMARKRKRTTVKPGWEYEEVDSEDEEMISSGSNVVSGSRPSTSGLKGKSNGGSIIRRRVVDSSSTESSESAEETDATSQARSHSKKKMHKGKLPAGPRCGSSSESAEETDASFEVRRRKNKKKVDKGKQPERDKSASKQPEKKAKGCKRKPLDKDPEIQEIALSGLANDVFVIGKPAVLASSDC